jgi:hypothetical protein
VAVDGAANCLTLYYPETPDAVVDFAKELISLAAERAQAAPTGAVLAEWMQVTGAELGQTGVTADETSGQAASNETVSTSTPRMTIAFRFGLLCSPSCCRRRRRGSGNERSRRAG